MNSDPLALYRPSGYAIRLEDERERQWKARDAAYSVTAWNGDIPATDTAEASDEDWWHATWTVATGSLEKLVAEYILEETQGHE